MKKELITELLQKFEQAAYEYQGIECWSARELQKVFSYTDWRMKAIDKAKKSCENAGEAVLDHFVGFNKMIDLAKGVQHEIGDFDNNTTVGTNTQRKRCATRKFTCTGRC